MAIEHLDPSVSPEKLKEILERDGACIVDRVCEPEVMDRLREELQPWIDATPAGRDDFAGRTTRRTGGLIGRSAAARELVEHPLVLDTVKQVLHHARNFQLHLTQVISIGPGSEAQSIHRDQWAFDFFPFPKGFDIQCNTIWAMSDFTEENGATRVVPGSNKADDRLQFALEDSEPAEMEKGSLLLYTGSVYHGGGPNRSDAVRYGLNITYVVAWLRQEENQYLSVPREVCAELPESLLRLMGYAQGAYALGYIDDGRDPIEIVRPELSRTSAGLSEVGDLEQAQERLRQRP
jgi:ectoine hydroxylase-related dioxygenase (phytanoyl-CoA dioxygenase family)